MKNSNMDIKIQTNKYKKESKRMPQLKHENFFMKQKDIDKSDKWFEKYGMRAAFICRFFPVLHNRYYEYYLLVCIDQNLIHKIHRYYFRLL